MNAPRIVIVGGGAGGLELVTRLGKKLGKKKKADIVLVDRDQTHVWKPLLHEVATGKLDSGLDEVSYQGHSRHNGYRFQRGTMTGLDREARRIHLAAIADEDGHEILPQRTLDYDYLVLSLGSVSNDFGTPGVSDNCYFLDSTLQAEQFRKALLNTFLRHNHQNDDQQTPLTLAIVGAGATGVELSAELLDATDMLNSYGVTRVDRHKLKIHLIEAAPRVLPALPERISQPVHRQLDRLGVQLHVDTRVTQADEHGFETGDGKRIEADLSVWAAGVRAPAFLSELGLSTRPNHQVLVHQNMQSVDDANIFAFGDCAACPQPGDKFVPPRAQAAHQQANLLFRNILAAMENKPLKDFNYRDLGSLISLAHFDAVGNLMRSSSSRGLFVEGKLAKLFYVSLYRMHQRAVHGTARAGLTMLVDALNSWIRPRMKLH
ncbi:NAD(P)/FAD-dependent oxidoreductase [Larsenimonas rhizosphaerae]|uniref:NAD(P)/FAD-dependent oxidoreductase n=1 Tax=Larsenimonas rhizosphaerae TaxID=2944682 RepID=A0AA42CU13_9GAMM|nr:NAD(P)/FAD-dependent oxidoreductase [Larsenimonas rhizosphaerae]MCM2131144.1 NAD(P)/FAD-dependent oxidoreductase [Larsenimonas rhizosphaerae]MCX2523849.1 NAD(P)/FAD-dependent oxidoreductase [Larsenimonas rhizosphaerae]